MQETGIVPHNVTARNMTAAEKIDAHKVRLLLYEPFFATILMHFDIVEVENHPIIDTMAVDGVHLFYNPEYVDKLTTDELTGSIVHEILHIALDHIWRLQEGMHMRKWNHATDYALNPEVIEGGYTLPKGALLDDKYKGKTAEEIYKLLPEPPEGDGLGVGGILAPPKDKDVQELQEELQDIVRQAAEVSPPGSVPQSVAQKLADDIEERHTLSVILRDFLTEIDDTDTRYPATDRYYQGDILLPGEFSEKIGKVCVCVDTSGSMSTEELNLAMENIYGICQDYDAELLLLDADAAIEKVREITADDLPVEFYGGGGTSFAPAMEYVRKEEFDIDVVLYITDMWCYDFGKDPGVPVIWCVTDKEGYEQYGQKAPFGRQVMINDD
jgi:predicted metal-dependent peptidase